MQRNRWLLNCAWGVCISHCTKSKQSPSRCCCLPKPGLLEAGQMCANRTDAETGATLLSHVFLAGLMFSLTSSLDPDKTSLLWTLRTGAQVQNCAERWEEAFALEPAVGDWRWLVLKGWPGGFPLCCDGAEKGLRLSRGQQRTGGVPCAAAEVLWGQTVVEARVGCRAVPGMCPWVQGSEGSGFRQGDKAP